MHIKVWKQKRVHDYLSDISLIREKHFMLSQLFVSKYVDAQVVPAYIV